MPARPVPRLGLSLVLSLVVVASLAACDAFRDDRSPGASGGGGDDAAVTVVATTTVLADLVAQVGGDRVSVASLVPAGGEVHTFDPTPSDVERLTRADLVVVNGVGLDEWAADLAADAGTGAPIVELGEDLPGVTYLEGHDDHAGEGGTGGEAADEHAVDPHLWLDVAIARAYVARIGEALAAVDPAGADAYAAGAEAYDARLADLDAFARETLGAIPAERRRVVSFHDAFPYFAAAYGIDIVDTVVDAPGQDPSAGEVADLVAAVRAEGVSAILAEAQFSDDLVRTLAEETGVAVVADLHTDSLGEPPLDTYEGIIRWDVERIAEALGG